MHKLDQLYPIDRHWAISEAYAAQAEGVLAGITIEAAEAARKSKAAQTDEEDPKPYEVVNGTAIFNLSGPMTKKPTSMSWLFGGTSTVMLRDSLRQAANDKSVKQGLLIVDSPGGQAQGTPELADEIRAFSAIKPIAAFADGMAASGAYWALAACDWIGAARMAEVGCIGTYQVVTDSSQAMASAGVKRLVYRAGKFKGAGYPGTEVTPEQHAEFQREVEAINAIFVSDIAALRGMNQDTVAELADGRIHVGQAALDLGLIDCVCTLDECFEMISNGVSPDGKSAASNGTTTSHIGERNMAETKPKPGFFARLIGLAKEHGIEVEDAAGGGASLDVPSAAAANAYLDELETKLKKSEAELATLKAGQTATPTPASQVITPPTNATPPTTITTTADHSVMAGLFVDAECSDLGADAKKQAVVIAKAMLAFDGGKPGEACEAFKAILATAKPMVDMKGKKLVLAQANTNAQQERAVKKLNTAASWINKFNSQPGVK